MSGGLRLAVAGKGGAGKSVVAGTLARELAREGRRVLALDSDLMPGLAFSLGATPPATPPLVDAAERDESGRWRFRRGVGPVRAIRRYATPAPDGVLLLQAGKMTREGLAPIMPALQAFYAVIHGVAGARSLREWDIVGDLSAGARQAAFDWAPYARQFVLLVEPTAKSALTGRRIARIARSRGAAVLPVANKVGARSDARVVERLLGEAVAAAIPLDDAVVEAERLGVALVDHAPDARAAAAVRALARKLRAR